MIKKINKKEIFLDSHSEPIILETGWKAKKANGSVWIKQGGTVVLVTAVMNKKNAAFADFFPLTVNYIEKFYAVGKIPGGFLKREGRPTDKETLVSRLIDRPLRPLFPDGFRNETQVIATVVSSDPTYPADILALNGASAAISISDIPFNGPVAAVRVGKKDGSLIVNPTQEEIDDLDLNIIVAGTYDAIVMVEAGMKNVKEEEVIESLDYGHSYIKKIAEAQVDFSKECGKEKFEYKDFSVDENLLSTVNNMVADKINEALRISDRNMRYEALDKIRERFLEGIGMDE
ncbi:MAG: polyribonucleotide nucleotidyltransferase, partial [Deferribacterota bacterium]|nr:polyribonucleotide nucleotidyltransferase [Deferribacterota bacterium]